MKPMVKILLIAVLAIVLLVALYVGGNILYATLTDFKPAEEEVLEVHNNAPNIIQDSVLSFLIWNIGFGGLGEKEDFFYDGGKMVRASKERVKQNLDGIYDLIAKNKEVDFVLLQEVDKNSKRSYYANQLEEIAEILPAHCYSFATNYLVRFIPMPLTVPPWKAMGKVESGLASYSMYRAANTKRYSFPGNYSWPSRVYFLDRCFLLQRFNLHNGKQLVVINTHNSAYDDGTLKAKQMDFLKDFLTSEYNKGNYVIVGGDWNQCPPGFDYQKFGKDEDQSYVQQNIAEDYLPNDWVWAYDDAVATNRKLDAPLEKGKTFTTLIDFFLASPNVEVIETSGVETDFKFSDHQPVFMKVQLVN